MLLATDLRLLGWAMLRLPFSDLWYQFRAKVYAHPEKLDTAVDSQAKLAVVLSLILWAGLIVSGRLIAFDASFDQ
jgi:hypothetical protein